MDFITSSMWDKGGVQEDANWFWTMRDKTEWIGFNV